MGKGAHQNETQKYAVNTMAIADIKHFFNVYTLKISNVRPKSVLKHHNLQRFNVQPASWTVEDTSADLELFLNSQDLCGFGTYGSIEEQYMDNKKCLCH